MGTRVELHLFGPGDDGALERARRKIEAVDDALTIHRPSPAVALNEVLAAGREAVVDDPVLLAALEQADELVRLTGGLFDPAAGGTGGWNAIGLDAAAARVRPHRPLALDFGGFGKGWALDRACAALREDGATSAFLSAGESSIAVIGRHPLGARWPVGVPHPLGDEDYLVELELEDEALSISATIGPGADAPGRSATVRPATGEPVADPRMAIVRDPSGARAEALSTALLIADHGERMRLAAPGRFVFQFEEPRAIPLIQHQDFSTHG